MPNYLHIADEADPSLFLASRKSAQHVLEEYHGQLGKLIRRIDSRVSELHLQFGQDSATIYHTKVLLLCGDSSTFLKLSGHLRSLIHTTNQIAKKYVTTHRKKLRNRPFLRAIAVTFEINQARRILLGLMQHYSKIVKANSPQLTHEYHNHLYLAIDGDPFFGWMAKTVLRHQSMPFVKKLVKLTNFTIAPYPVYQPSGLLANPEQKDRGEQILNDHADIAATRL